MWVLFCWRIITGLNSSRQWLYIVRIRNRIERRVQTPETRTRTCRPWRSARFFHEKCYQTTVKISLAVMTGAYRVCINDDTAFVAQHEGGGGEYWKFIDLLLRYGSDNRAKIAGITLVHPDRYKPFNKNLNEVKISVFCTIIVCFYNFFVFCLHIISSCSRQTKKNYKNI